MLKMRAMKILWFNHCAKNIHIKMCGTAEVEKYIWNSLQDISGDLFLMAYRWSNIMQSPCNKIVSVMVDQPCHCPIQHLREPEAVWTK